MNTVRGWFMGTGVRDGNAERVAQPAMKREVYPVHTLDGMKDYEAFVGTVMLFNDVLDSNLLSTTLSRLLEIGDWKKLGGRLRRDANGRLHLHVPLTFSAEQPAITYTHEGLQSMKISEHPVAKLLPSPTCDPSVQTLPRGTDFRTLQVRQGFPTSVDALVDTDLPSIALHIHSFQDATVVGLAWPHLLMDGLGRAELMKAWSLVLTGQENKVPQVSGARDDVLLRIPPVESDQDKLFAARGFLSITDLAKFVCRWQWERVTGHGKVVKAIYLPKANYDRLVGRIKDEVSRVETKSVEKPFVSQADAVTGWITQQISVLEPRPKPVTIMNIVNCRYRIQQWLDSECVYLQNMLMMTYTSLSAHEACGSAADLALAHRAQVAQQTTRERVVGFIQWLQKRIDNNERRMPLSGNADSTFICVNSLAKADLITTTDFSSAVLRQGQTEEKRNNPVGTMVNFFFRDVNNDIAPIHSFTVLGMDHNGGTWFVGSLTSKTWEAVEQQLSE